jgi:hypothetical protein
MGKLLHAGNQRQPRYTTSPGRNFDLEKLDTKAAIMIFQKHGAEIELVDIGSSAKAVQARNKRKGFINIARPVHLSHQNRRLIRLLCRTTVPQRGGGESSVALRERFDVLIILKTCKSSKCWDL